MRENRESKPRIEIIKRLTSQAYFCRDALLFRVKDGSGRLLCRNVSEDGKRSEKNHIYLDDSVLFHMRINDCASYSGWVQNCSGKALNSLTELRREADGINAPYTNIEDAVNRMPSLLGLLESGYYIAADYELFPVVRDAYDGDAPGGGEDVYFWDLHAHKSWLTQERGWIMGDVQKYHFPLYLAPTQSARTFDPECADKYRTRLLQEENRFPRCIALYLNGGYALLLDGHHKAVASAAEGKRVKTIVLFPMTIPDPKHIGDSGRLYFSNGINGLVLCDGQHNELGSVQTLEDAKIKTVPEAELYRNAPSLSEWGSIPEEYRKQLDGYPSQRQLMEGTWYPQYRIRSLFEEYRKAREKEIMALRSGEPQELVQDEERLICFFENYMDIFPESKWFGQEDMRKMEEVREWYQKEYIDYLCKRYEKENGR